MKHFLLEQSDDEFYTSHSGLVLAGLCINRYSKPNYELVKYKWKAYLGACPRIGIFPQIKAFVKFYHRHIVDIPRIKFYK